MNNNDKLDLPFSTITIKKPHSTAAALGWKFEISLSNDRPLAFVGLAFLPAEQEYQDKALQEIVARINDTVTYQKQLLEGNRVSVTNEDFFEQCLQKINSEISLLLRDLPVSLSVNTWGLMIAMISKSSNPNKMEFFTSRFGELTGWLLHDSQLDTKKLISIYDEPDPAPEGSTLHKFFKNIISSELSINDQLFFCSPNLLDYVSLSELKKVLSTLSVQGAMKHLHNQITFDAADNLISALSLRLSAYPIITRKEVAPKEMDVQSSMNSLINTQDETEKLLGTSLGINVKRIKDYFLSKTQALKRKAKHAESEIVPSNLSNRAQPTMVSRTLAVIISTAGSVVVIIQKTTRLVISKVPRKQLADYNKKIGFLSDTKTITKVNILKKKFKDMAAPVSARLKFFSRLAKQNSTKKVLKSPVFIGSIVVIIALVVGLSFAKKNSNIKVANIDAAQASIDSVINNINLIDSHLIVGRESDAVKLVQESFALLASVNDIESLANEKERLSDELLTRQQRVRKEIVITSAEIIAPDLSGSLGSAPVAMAGFEDTLYVIADNPRSILKFSLIDNTGEKVSITTDVNQIQYAVVDNANRMIWLNNNSVSVVDLSTNETVTAVANIQTPLRGAEVFNNRFYSLSEADNQIMRSNREPNFSVVNPWINQTGITLANARDLTIDGSIYVLVADKVIRFVSGSLANPQPSFDAVDPPLSNGLFIWTNADSDRIYVLEPGRLIVHEKKGKFVAQYTIPDTTFKDFYIDENSSSAYLLTDNELLKITL